MSHAYAIFFFLLVQGVEGNMLAARPLQQSSMSPINAYFGRRTVAKNELFIVLLIVSFYPAAVSVTEVLLSWDAVHWWVCTSAKKAKKQYHSTRPHLEKLSNEHYSKCFLFAVHDLSRRWTLFHDLWSKPLLRYNLTSKHCNNFESACCAICSADSW